METQSTAAYIRQMFDFSLTVKSEGGGRLGLAWCFCPHHFLFHEAFGNQDVPQLVALPLPGCDSRAPGLRWQRELSFKLSYQLSF